jgi:glycosyltransferase involved in cell wall biosynthesis
MATGVRTVTARGDQLAGADRGERTGIEETRRECELSIIMPCLNEARTVATCIRKARDFLDRSGIRGEVLVADNGSTDGSIEAAAAAGARVVFVPTRGYGAALLGGIGAAEGRYVIMGDADDSYDFTELAVFVEKLRAGADLVIGNRFRGGIEAGAMPFLHRFVGNPLLSLLGRTFFSIRLGDFHCGLRGFDRRCVLALDLRTTGMEFASEMIVRSALAGYRIAEVPTTLKKDGRDRPPHLRTWRDGWLHLRFLLLYSPKWLFFYPGVALFGCGLAGTALLLPGPLYLGNLQVDIHTFLVACISMLLGIQSISFAAIARRFATARGFIPRSPRYGVALAALRLEHLLIAALGLVMLGVAALVWCILVWRSTGFGQLDHPPLVRAVTLSLTAIAAGMQLIFTAFLSGLMDIPVSGDDHGPPDDAQRARVRGIPPEDDQVR